jgi:hypothetical protein
MGGGGGNKAIPRIAHSKKLREKEDFIDSIWIA